MTAPVAADPGWARVSGRHVVTGRLANRGQHLDWPWHIVQALHSDDDIVWSTIQARGHVGVVEPHAVGNPRLGRVLAGRPQRAGVHVEPFDLNAGEG